MKRLRIFVAVSYMGNRMPRLMCGLKTEVDQALELAGDLLVSQQAMANIVARLNLPPDQASYQFDCRKE